MPRYIDADALTLKLKTQDYSGAPDTLEDWTPQDMTNAEISDIEHEPTADVRENVHAHWKIVYDEGCDDGGKYVCGNCRHAFSFGAYFELCRFDYCPNCGAEMRGEE